ncbi:MAG: DUF1073 domain-containing protein [Verrucomicrobia bacterium]|nr:DUF1073 domain-containing protein [Verrucomicrobiota bacterium]
MTTLARDNGGPIVNLGHFDSAGVRTDGLANVFTGMGIQGRDKSQSTITQPIIFLTQEELEGLYGEWIPRRVVDIVADQSTRKGFRILFGGDGAKAQEIVGMEQVIEDLMILENFNLASKNERLYGGAAILLYINDGRSADQPVDKSKIVEVEGMEVLDRYQIAPMIGEESLYDYAKATYYQIISGDLIQQPNLTRIHKDRILRFDGMWLPYRIRQRNYGWGMSSIQPIYDSFRHYWTGVHSASMLLSEFDIFVHKIRNLSQMLANGKESDVKNRLVLNDMSKSVYRGFAIDAEKEELSFITRQFSGIDGVLEKLRIDIIGASQIPHTILFGESPSGIGATGRSEERDFAKLLGDYQASHFRRPLKKLMEYILLSQRGPTSGRIPDSWRVKFNDLFELNEREKADVRARVAAVDGRYIQLGVLHPKEVADARYGGSEWSMETTLDPSLPRELPQQTQGKPVPPGGRDPLNEQNGTLPMDGSRDVVDSEAGLFLPRDLEKRRDVKFQDEALHSRAVSEAKQKFNVWPSAYASAYVVQHYKALYKEKHGSLSGAFKADGEEINADDLEQWFQEKWVRIGGNGEILGPCGDRGEGEGKPKCLPQAKAQSMSKSERQTIVARKREADPDPERKGAAKMVSSKVDAIDPIKASGTIVGGIDEAALIEDDDIKAALEQWQKEAPERYKTLLEATDLDPQQQ